MLIVDIHLVFVSAHVCILASTGTPSTLLVWSQIRLGAISVTPSTKTQTHYFHLRVSCLTGSDISSSI